MKTRLSGILFLSFGLAGMVRADAGPTQIEAWISKQIEAGGIAAAVVAEVCDGAIDTRGFGHRDLSGGAAPDADTQFQIGSVTKVFTHLLLAELDAAGTARADSTVGEWMPAPFRPRNPAVASITLQALATHSSGLPRLPANLAMDNPADPYAGYDAKALLTGLKTVRDKQPLGHFYAYSNLGVGLLGHLLGRADGAGYRAAVANHVIAPLHLLRTAFQPGANAALPSSGGKPVPPWTFDDALAGAGALWSSAGDMGRLIQAALGVRDHALKHAMKADFDIAVSDAGGFAVTRVWHVAYADNVPIFWHNGAVAGFHSFVGFRPDRRRGVAILVSGDADPTATGLQSLGHTKKAPAPAEIDRGILGQYRMTERFGLGVFELDGALVTQASGQAPVALFPVGEDWYALGDVDASLHFIREAGAVTKVELAQNGVLQPAERVADTAAVAVRKEITLDAGALRDYIGSYHFAPGAVLTVKRGDAGLEAQLTGQPFLPVYPRGSDRFFYKVVDAELVFERDPGGEVSAVVLHQGGIEQRAARGSK